MEIAHDSLRQKMAAIVERHGEWTSMSIQLADGLSTIDPPSPDPRLRRLVQLATDLARKPLAESRVLDLACLEGHYAIEFALQAAEVVGIEGREANFAKARFAKEALGLDRLTFFHDDVRDLSLEKYGAFDIVICSGILYHLDSPDIFNFVKRISEVCRNLAFIDTFFSLRDKVSFEFEGRTYWGRYDQEHQSGTTHEEQLKARWLSIGNLRSVWLTRPSLVNLLQNVGFSSVLECDAPPMLSLTFDRSLFVAAKGERARVLSSAPTDCLETQSWPEHRSYRVDWSQNPKVEAVRRVESILPPGVRGSLKRACAWFRRTMRGPEGPWDWTQPWHRR